MKLTLPACRPLGLAVHTVCMSVLHQVLMPFKVLPSHDLIQRLHGESYDHCDLYIDLQACHASCLVDAHIQRRSMTLSDVELPHTKSNDIA